VPTVEVERVGMQVDFKTFVPVFLFLLPYIVPLFSQLLMKRNSCGGRENHIKVRWRERGKNAARW